MAHITANTIRNNPYTFTIGNEEEFILWFYGSRLRFYKTFQIEKGSTATPYEPYQEPVTYTISLSAPLRSNGDKKDYIDFESGKVIRWVASDGSVLSTSTEETITLPDIKTLNGTTIISTNTTVQPTIEGRY